MSQDQDGAGAECPQKASVAEPPSKFEDRSHYHEYCPPDTAFSRRLLKSSVGSSRRGHDSAWSWRPRRGRETSATALRIHHVPFPGQAVTQPPLMWGRVTGLASGSTRLASALRLCSSAPMAAH